MRAAGQTATPLGGGIIAPPWTTAPATTIPVFMPSIGVYGEQPFLQANAAPVGNDSASISADEPEVVLLPLQGQATIADTASSPVLDQAVAPVQGHRSWFRRVLGGAGELLGALFEGPPCSDPLTGDSVRPTNIRDSYVVNRGMRESSTYTKRAMGRTLDAWVVQELLAASAVGQKVFRIAVIGPGEGNAERELVETLAPIAKGLGMRVEISAITLPSHPMTPENLAAISAFRSAGIFFSQQFLDYDQAELPFAGADVLYGIQSTVYSRAPAALTEKIHNSLRPPSGSRPGGQAFFFYRHYLDEPALTMATHAHVLRTLGIDAAVVHPADMFVSTVLLSRTRDGPLENFGQVIQGVERSNQKRRMVSYRLHQSSDPVVVDTPARFDEAFGLYVHGAELLFAANGVVPSALSEAAHRRSFDLISGNILTGVPIYPDAVGIAYGDRATLDAITGHGDDFARHLPAMRTPTQRSLVGEMTGIPRFRITY